MNSREKIKSFFAEAKARRVVQLQLPPTYSDGVYEFERLINECKRLDHLMESRKKQEQEENAES